MLCFCVFWQGVSIHQLSKVTFPDLISGQQVTDDRIDARELVSWRNLREETFAYMIVPVMVMNQQNQVCAYALLCGTLVQAMYAACIMQSSLNRTDGLRCCRWLHISSRPGFSLRDAGNHTNGFCQCNAIASMGCVSIFHMRHVRLLR